MLRKLARFGTHSRSVRAMIVIAGAATLLGLGALLSPVASTPAEAQGYGNYQCSIAFTCQRSPYYDSRDQTVYRYPPGYAQQQYLFPNYGSPTYYYQSGGSTAYPAIYGSLASRSYSPFSQCSYFPYCSGYSPYLSTSSYSSSYFPYSYYSSLYGGGYGGYGGGYGYPWGYGYY